MKHRKYTITDYLIIAAFLLAVLILAGVVR